MAESDGVPEDIGLRICFRLGVHSFLGDLFDFQRHDVGRILLASRNPPEIFFRQLHGRLFLKVADQNHRDVLRGIIYAVEGVGLCLRNRRNI